MNPIQHIDGLTTGHIVSRIQQRIVDELYQFGMAIPFIKQRIGDHAVRQGESRFICPLIWRALRRNGYTDIPEAWEHYGNDIHSTPINYDDPVWNEMVAEHFSTPEIITYLHDLLIPTMVAHVHAVAAPVHTVVSVSKAEWTCTVCTFLNKSGTTRCEMCENLYQGKSRKGKSRKVKSRKEKSRKGKSRKEKSRKGKSRKEKSRKGKSSGRK